MPLAFRRSSQALRSLSRSRKFVIGFAIVLILVIVSLSANLVYPGNPASVERYPHDLSPSWEHPLGTDSLGRDVFVQLLHGTQQSLLIGVMAGAVGVGIGTTLGFIAGYKGGILDGVIRSITDVFLVIPTWPLLVVLASYTTVVTVPLLASVLAALSWPGPARVVRSQVLSLRRREFVSLAKISGRNSLEISFLELMPNMLSYLGVRFAAAISGAMLAEVGLDLIGLGPQGSITLGMMLYYAQLKSALMRNLWWWLFPPIIVLILVFVGLNLINLGLDEVYNPRLRKR